MSTCTMIREPSMRGMFLAVGGMEAGSKPSRDSVREWMTFPHTPEQAALLLGCDMWAARGIDSHYSIRMGK